MVCTTCVDERSTYIFETRNVLLPLVARPDATPDEFVFTGTPSASRTLFTITFGTGFPDVSFTVTVTRAESCDINLIVLIKYWNTSFGVDVSKRPTDSFVSSVTVSSFVYLS